jgi:amidase
MTDIFDPFASATTMLAAMHLRHISAVELLDYHLRRIARFNPTLNAIVIPDFEQARQAAAEADAARTAGHDAPLLGLPITLKDTIDVAGLRSTAGVESFAHYHATADAPLTARLRSAGAIIIGKTNVPPWTADWQTNNPLFGRSNNPWDLTRTPGGSTGGGAAAVAAALTALEFGTDFAGSIRIPAAFCGIYGHKPSETAVPRSGLFPGATLPNAATALAVAGPLARSAPDLELALTTIAGADIGEDTAWHLTFPPARHARLVQYRIAVLPLLDWVPIDEQIVGALDRLTTKLRHLGASVAVVPPDLPANMHDMYDLYLSLFWALSSTDQPVEERQRDANELFATHDRALVACARGLIASAADYIQWHRQRERYRAAYRSFFRDWDVLLTSVNIVHAFPHTEIAQQHYLEVNGSRVNYSLQSVYPAIATLTGQPATVFPVGLSDSGVPIGLQAIGPYLEDRTPIAFAHLVAQEFGGFLSPPGY